MSRIRTIKPIETAYQGYRMRSRLEARWAVFFDELGIPWQYELEGFDLGDGVNYLPDFYLPVHGAFVEVKPVLAAISRQEWEKIARLIRHKSLLLAAGLPGTEHLFLFLNDGGAIVSDGLLEWLNECFADPAGWASFFLENYSSHQVEFVPRVILLPHVQPPDEADFCVWGFALRRWDASRRLLLECALRSAKSARFEAGEKRGSR